MWCLEQELVYYYTLSILCYSIGIYSSANFGYVECSRSSVRYTCSLCNTCNTVVSTMCVVSSLSRYQILLSCSWLTLNTRCDAVNNRVQVKHLVMKRQKVHYN